MKNITIFALHLNYGGIEKAIVTLANNLCDKYRVEILSLYKINENPVFEINKKVSVSYILTEKPTKKEWLESIKKLKFIPFFKESWNNFKILFLFRRRNLIKAIKNCESDIVISTKASINKKLGKYGKKNQLKIGWEHSHHHGNMRYANKVTDSVKNLDYFVLVSSDLKNYYEKRLVNTNCKCITIPNYIDELPNRVSDYKNKSLISVGRLSKEKVYDDLIDVFNLVVKEKKDYQLHIVGDGIEKEMLIKKINQLNLNKNIIMHGFKPPKERNELLQKSSLYLMTSHTESFGISLLEAMAYGLPCITFDRAEGACDIIEHKKTGYLIPNSNKELMAKKVIEILNDYDLMKILGKNAKDKCKKYLSIKIIPKWITLIKGENLYYYY